jgi:ribonuclease Z
MKLTLLGTGTPVPEIERQGSACCVQIGQQKLLFDAGRGVNTQLLRVGLSPDQIDHVFITHHHADHIGDLGDVLLAAWHGGRKKKLKLTGPPGTCALVTALMDQVYRRDVEFAMRLEQRVGNAMVDIWDMLTIADVEPGLVAEDQDWRVFAERVDHGRALGFSDDAFPCLGYRIEAEDKVIALSGDTILCDGLNRLAHNADILIQCCYLAEAEITNQVFEYLSRHIIASSGQVGKIAARAGVGTLILTHFRKKSDEMMQSILEDVRKDYAGNVILAHDLLEIEI